MSIVQWNEDGAAFLGRICVGCVKRVVPEDWDERPDRTWRRRSAEGHADCGRFASGPARKVRGAASHSMDSRSNNRCRWGPGRAGALRFSS